MKLWFWNGTQIINKKQSKKNKNATPTDNENSDEPAVVHPTLEDLMSVIESKIKCPMWYINLLPFPSTEEEEEEGVEPLIEEPWNDYY